MDSSKDEGRVYIFSLISVLQYIPTDRSQYHFVSKCEEEIFLFFISIDLSLGRS